MPSFDPKFLARFKAEPAEQKALQLLAAARARMGQIVKLEPEVLESLRQHALVESTESSNRIEGIVTSADRLYRLLKKKSKPDTRDEAQISGYRDALALIHDPRKRPQATEKALLSLHRSLSAAEPGSGRYKTRDNLIVQRDAVGKAHLRFRPLSAKATPGAMRQWFLHHHIQDEIDPLLGMGLLILDLTCIHPFKDGNGRLSRLWTLLLAYEQGLEIGRYISLERLTEQSKDRYYQTLAASSQGWHEGRHNPHPWLGYLLHILLSAYLELEARLQGVRGQRGDKSALVRNAALAMPGDFSLIQLERACEPISKDMVRLVLRKLRQEGAILMSGRGRGAVYYRDRSI